jgi:hypothetical protein
VVDCVGFLEFIPGGYTWKLQVMGNGINKPFKECFQDEYNQWLFGNGCSGRLLREDVVKWVKVSYNGIIEATIIKTWKRGLKYNDKVVQEQQQQLNTGNENNNSDDDETIADNKDDIVDRLCFQRLGIDELTPEEREVENYYNNLLPLEK